MISAPYWTLAEAADYAKVSIRTISRAVAAGNLRVASGGPPGLRRTREEWVIEWMEGRSRDQNGRSNG
jgi:excisionase family DNA binding protein